MKINNEDGQSTIEFILGFTFTIGILFVFISLGLNYGVGYLNHYATFMASRVFLVAENSGFDSNGSYQKGEDQGREIFNSFTLDRFGARNMNLEFNTPGEANLKAYIGAYTIFERPLSQFQAFGGGINLTLHSESFLGKEPTRIDCALNTCEAMTGNRNGCSPALDITLFDNGC